SKIVWGDYASERGLLTGIYSGLILNTVPVVPADLASTYPVTVDSVGYTFAGGTSGWNTKPAIQYVPRGRRAFGPYTFSSGGAVELIDKKSTVGEGRFWIRVPSSRTSMSTTISNPMPQSLQIEITVNGVSSPVMVPGKSFSTVKTPLTRADKTISVSFKGDRRLVLLETDFK
ncbi:MAG: glycosyl hydrolase family 2, partial [Gemmatimonadales bacterium]